MNRLQRRWSRRLQRLEAVLQYIENHCGDALDVPALASMAAISPFHFHRVFSAHVGEPVLAYIRRLRLEKAAWRILYLERTVTEAAQSAGYSSAAAFTRAFRGHFGTTPRKFVRSLLHLRPGSGGAHVISLRPPEYRHLPVFTVVGIKRLGSYGSAPAAAWEALDRQLAGILPDAGCRVGVGIPLDWPELTPEERCRYEACIAADLPPDGERFRKQVGGGAYAVFRHTGDCQNLRTFQEAIYWHWLPRFRVRLRDAPVLHLYRSGSGFPGPDRPVEICIPVETPGTQWVQPGAACEPVRAEC